MCEKDAKGDQKFLTLPILMTDKRAIMFHTMNIYLHFVIIVDFIHEQTTDVIRCFLCILITL